MSGDETRQLELIRDEDGAINGDHTPVAALIYSLQAIPLPFKLRLHGKVVSFRSLDHLNGFVEGFNTAWDMASDGHLPMS
jgi:hypothetical protein